MNRETAFSTMMKDRQERLSSSNLELRDVALIVTLMKSPALASAGLVIVRLKNTLELPGTRLNSVSSMWKTHPTDSAQSS
ncbi:MAG: hypothetical protein GWN18_17515 [Thermoplasmata archaeon]|nr:hypothetical protein [Thermoplasmata archaeon]NIT79354.1 hypothetical protein [Thermoplasmata archaeon]NIU50791.1 hypothetical protein [Thermoplasmata archaeon]NIV80511.1 hypothetical protein [Thermoplasmata archaeon]NIW84316.1 hypothetical protein [Thermoplasmata archaeon]